MCNPMKLYDYLKEHMLKYPQQMLTNGTVHITYIQLLDFAQQQAKLLTKQKYGILCENSLNTAKAILSCLCAGKTAVILSSKYGEQHCEKIIEKTKLSYLITDDEIKQIAEEQPEYEDLSDVALIMCTSGTTGSPKGAMITNDNLLINLKDIKAYFTIHTNDRILITRPLYHCAVLTGEFLISLLQGAQIYFYDGVFNPLSILSKIQKDDITVFCATPTILYHLSVIACRKKEKPPLEKIAVSGECMTGTVAMKIRECLPDTDIFHVYGLTEASPRVSFLLPEQFDSNPYSVGIPLQSLLVKLENEELLVKGGSVTKGYYEDKAATSKVIKGGWLHTGDLAEISLDGLITIKGRKDHLIIRGGMNIYPAEIENNLLQDKNIEEAMAYGVNDKTVGQKICLTVVSRLTKDEVFALCREKLPAYQHPDVIEIVKELPRNASGKLIRRKP